MPIFQGSRYAGVPFTGVRDRVGVVRRFLHSRVPFTEDDLAPGVAVHEYQHGEELDELSHKFGAFERDWWLIADVNGVLFAFDIEIGTPLLIPQPELFQSVG